jgi:hypothetical protein
VADDVVVEVVDDGRGIADRAARSGIRNLEGRAGWSRVDVLERHFPTAPIGGKIRTVTPRARVSQASAPERSNVR